MGSIFSKILRPKGLVHFYMHFNINATREMKGDAAQTKRIFPLQDQAQAFYQKGCDNSDDICFWSWLSLVCNC